MAQLTDINFGNSLIFTPKGHQLIKAGSSRLLKSRGLWGCYQA